ncbi:class I SAM-dependent methyltransferase [Chitinophaga alhagiae]|uniref:class I SAM-dependent methyltransferase n=1 Tax=Chitinophaga alhagiae TaxID=2203219 RepID=UPI000E5BFCE6|nr:class I SAM-dependent methyltransferase [Chitinophaga alhagiae]
MKNRKDHWETVYATKRPDEVSWTQDVPQTSLDFIRSFNLPKTASIIDVGGGDSKLADFLLNEGFENITVLDISAVALDRVKARLGERASRIRWVVQDVTAFEPAAAFDLWHDRATFHFLTTEEQISKYLDTITRNVKKGGHAVIGTFSTSGPEKCSGLPIQQYNEETLGQRLQAGFEKIKCITEDHTTPFHTTQNFLFCSFRRKANG